MSRTLREYGDRRGRTSRFPLLRMLEQVRSGDARAAELEQLAAEAGLPVAAARGVLSYYADLRAEPRYPRVCRGTSCALNGGPDLARQIGEVEHESSLYCLGYCDRSPAWLNGEFDVRLGVEESEVSLSTPPGPPSIRCLAREPIATRRSARGDFSELEAARADGAYRALERALRGAPDAVLEAVERSGERGRGGAAFPTGAKWRRCAEVDAPERYVVANGDEGDPGSFVDRVLMELDPHAVLEGLILCAYAVGAREGIVFVRSEYPWARRTMQLAIEQARAAGLLGESVLGSGFAFDVALFRGLGSYVCGEETALLNAIEGLRGEVRVRPPYPAVEGLFGRPTVVNNVETLANVPWILERGARAYAALGTESSPGTKALCLNRGFARPGIVEVELGLPLREVIDEAGGGRDGELEAVLVGGPMGSIVTPDAWDVPVCYGAMSARNIQLGHGGLVATPRGTDWRALLEHWLRFQSEESCGKCVPCGLGSRAALALAGSLGEPAAKDELEGLLSLMEHGSLCAFGRLIPAPVRSIIERLGDQVRGTDR